MIHAHVEVEKNIKNVVESKGSLMFILRFADDDDNLSVKDFTSLTDLKKYISENDIDKTWHQIEEVKKVIPNLKEE